MLAQPELHFERPSKKRMRAAWDCDSKKPDPGGDHSGHSAEVQASLQSTASNPIIGFLMIVGPGEGVIASQAICHILHSYPDSKIWLRDDCTHDGTFERLKNLADAHPHRIDLARNSVPLGFKGIAVSAFRSFERICQSGENLEMVIQLDPDVVLAGNEIIASARTKFAGAGPGIIGSYMLSPEKTRRSHTSHRNHILADLFPLGFDRHHRLLRFGLPFYAKYLPKAFRNGYRLGHHVLGAFYIMHGDTLRALDSVGFWGAMPDLGSREVKLDDPLVSIGPYIVGHKLIDLHDRSDSRFWVQLNNPAPLTAEEIIARRYLAVHPVKNDAAGSAIRTQLAKIAPQSAIEEVSTAPANA
jgi:hypothetical protein